MTMNDNITINVNGILRRSGRYPWGSEVDPYPFCSVDSVKSEPNFLNDDYTYPEGEVLKQSDS